MIKIYHNPRCSKSRETCSLLDNVKTKYEIINYLENTPTEKELKEIIKMLGIKASALVRKKEPLFKEKYSGKNLTEDQWIKAMVQNPILIERPIVIKGKKAALGRPPENILTI
jgi:arsenate reductase